MPRRQVKIFFVAGTLFWLAGVLYFAKFLTQNEANTVSESQRGGHVRTANKVIKTVVAIQGGNVNEIDQPAQQVEKHTDGNPPLPDENDLGLESAETSLPPDILASGLIQQNDLCIVRAESIDKGRLSLGVCNATDPLQQWTLSRNGYLSAINGVCLQVEDESYAIIDRCSFEKDQVWLREGAQIQHDQTTLCIDSHKPEHGLVLGECESSDTQLWRFSREAN